MPTLPGLYGRVALLGSLLTLPWLVLADDPIERGRYLVQTSGCNDCHTAGYLLAPDKVPESAWLLGDQLGWSGPWGTTYASNLRLVVSPLSEAQWLLLARNANYRPPMPNHVLRIMREEDLRGIYRFIQHLGPAGQPAPAYLPPEQKPQGPAVVFPAPAQ